MKKLILFTFIGSSLLIACQPATPLTTVTLTFAPTITSVPTETPTPIPVSESTPTLEVIEGGWSTFQAQEYGFRFLYPAVYDKGFYDPADPLTFCKIDTKKEEDKFNVWVGFVAVAVSETSQSLQDVSGDYVRDKSVDWNILSQAQLKIDGLSAVTVEYGHQNPDRWGFKTFLIHDNDLLTIDYYEAPSPVAVRWVLSIPVIGSINKLSTLCGLIHSPILTYYSLLPHLTIPHIARPPKINTTIAAPTRIALNERLSSR